MIVTWQNMKSFMGSVYFCKVMFTSLTSITDISTQNVNGDTECKLYYWPGRQFIKEVLVDGQSHLLIIREETELPGPQVGGRLT